MSDPTVTAEGVSVTWKGLNVVTKRLDLIVTRLKPALGGVLYRHLEKVKTRSQGEFVPVKDGILRGSAFVDQPTMSPTEIRGRMGYGGAAGAYAAAQHENMEYHHEVGGPKYLERPLLMSLDELKQDIAGGTKTTVAEAAKA